MAITYLGSVTGNDDNGAGFSISLTGLSLLENDLVLVVWGHGNSGTDHDMSISGYTEIFDLYNKYSGSTQSINFYGGYKVMGSTPDSTVSIPALGGSSDSACAIAYCFRGVNTTTPMDATATTAVKVSASTQANSPSITPVTTGAIVISTIGLNENNSYLPATLVSGYSQFVEATSNDTYDSYIAIGQKSWSGSGAEDPGVWATGFPDSWVAATIALRPTITTLIKSCNGLAKSSIKSFSGLATASVKSVNSLT